MHDGQVHIDSDVARQMILDQFPQFLGETISPITTSGTVNAVFRIGTGSAARFSLRATEPNKCADLLRVEAAAMVELAELCPFPTPRPIALGKPGPLYPMPWSIQTWIDGEVASPAGLRSSNGFALDLVCLVTSLRQGDLKGRCFDGRGRGGDLSDHDEWMEVCFSKSEDLLNVGELRRIWARFRDLPRAGPEVMSHKDLIPANLLVQGQRLIGVLDGGGFGPADPSLDLVVAWHLLDGERRAVFRETIQANDLEWERGAAWAFQQAMGLVWYYQTTNPAMSALGRSTISRIKGDTLA